MMRKYSKTPDPGTILVSNRVEKNESSQQQEGEDVKTDGAPTNTKTEG